MFKTAAGWDKDFYAGSSVLSRGEWVKIGVETTGIYFISGYELGKMGFSDISKVGVYGYGGRRLPDVLQRESYIDDLPRVPVMRADGGIYFYAIGTDERNISENGHLIISRNPFSESGYYFLCDNGLSDEPLKEAGEIGVADDAPATTFTEVVMHERDLWSPGETGHLMLGEEMRYTPSRSFLFELPGTATGQAVAGTSLFTNLIGGSVWTLEAGNKSTKFPVAATPMSEFIHGYKNEGWTDAFEIDGDKGEITVKVSLAGGSANVRNANLDWVAINYPRQIKLDEEHRTLIFYCSQSSVRIAGASKTTEVWDVTDVKNIRRMRVSAPDAEGNIFFTTSFPGERMYAVFTPGEPEKIQAPVYIGKVSNQDLHSVSGIEMAIFTTRTLLSAANKLASHRTSKGINTAVFVQDEVFNEFSSGTPDVNSFRKFLKMLHDRDGAMLKYVLLFGKSSFDNRGLMATNRTYDTLPQWQTDEGENDNTSFPTDDIIGFLDDGSGRDMASDTLSVAIGRITATSLAEANLIVDKIISYENEAPDGDWNNRLVFIADDEDNGVHMTQTENQIASFESTHGGSKLLVDKIYIDAYALNNSVAQGARDELYRLLDEGALWVNYIGHANATSLSAEGILNYSDVSSLFLRHVPFIYAATCDFMRWDASTVSGAERLFFTKGGGVIGAISATRPVYISQNGNLSAEIGRYMMANGLDGTPLTIGEVLMKAKNGYSVNGVKRADDNKLRYGLLGDPSMKLRIPTCDVKVLEIDSISIQENEFPVLGARQESTVKGIIVENGKPCVDFEGIISLTVYDADESVTTEGRGDGVRFTFDRHGSRLFMGTDSVKNGRFNVKVIMPSEVGDNYRPATMKFHAEEKGTGKEASGIERRFYVFGMDEDFLPDTVPPVIESLYLNNSKFIESGTVNPSPMVIAGVSDNRAINLSQAGVGHQMMISIDNGTSVYSDVSNYYQPDGVDCGMIYYRLKDLPDGYHTLTLRIWDTSGNSASRTVEFFVDSGVRPVVYDIYADNSPASTSVNFYIVHDRPDTNMRVTLAIYDISGRPVWLNTMTGRSDKFSTSPITWNLTDMNGSRVGRGIYLYRASVSEYNGTQGSGAETLTPTKKIAVSGR